MKVNPKRVRVIKDTPVAGGKCVVYWMSREQRANDNWALLYAQDISQQLNLPLIVIFILDTYKTEASQDHFNFMLKGLEQVSQQLGKLNIPFNLLNGSAITIIPQLIKNDYCAYLVTDFAPTNKNRHIKSQISQNIEIPFVEVDSHNIVPCFVASDKMEYGARTIRPKIHKHLREFLGQFPSVKPQKQKIEIKTKYITFKEAYDLVSKLPTYNQKYIVFPGEQNAFKTLENFIEKKLNNYEKNRNNPNYDNTSNLSAYLHFGQISSQRVALEVNKAKAVYKSKNAFLEELIVRKELSDNFCFYNKNYADFAGFANWAQKTLNEHRSDTREYLYSFHEFEKAKTHDNLWNAAQMEMVKTGKMRGYLRMYWAKKILEWSLNPEIALDTANKLNNKYELDGRDPNGYAGVAWAIGGTHDRPWFERDIYGTVRYMSYNGCKAKFDIQKYIETVQSI